MSFWLSSNSSVLYNFIYTKSIKMLTYFIIMYILYDFLCLLSHFVYPNGSMVSFLMLNHDSCFFLFDHLFLRYQGKWFCLDIIKEMPEVSTTRWGINFQEFLYETRMGWTTFAVHVPEPFFNVSMNADANIYFGSLMVWSPSEPLLGEPLYQPFKMAFAPEFTDLNPDFVLFFDYKNENFALVRLSMFSPSGAMAYVMKMVGTPSQVDESIEFFFEMFDE